MPTLHADRVKLRPTRPSDAEQILATFGHPENMRYWGHEPFKTLQEASAYQLRIESNYEARELFQWAIALQDDDLLIGTVTLLDWDKSHRRAEIGFIVNPAFQGRGLASEAVRRVLRFAFEDMNLHRVEADVDPENKASQRLLQRMGFREEGRLTERWFTYGRWNDSVLYGLLRREFAS